MTKFCYLILLFTFINVQAQKTATASKGVITGKIVEANTNNPIEYATITVFPIGSLKPVTGNISNSKGSFKIGDLAVGIYTVTIEFIGFASNKIDSLSITATKSTISLGTISLTNKSQILQNVTVTANTLVIENKIDKLIYNVEKDITSQGGVATDVLKKVPQVFVDIDGNIELLGSTSIRFLINGKPSSIFGNSISDALQSIPASQIQSIEVITSPGAKYAIQGTGGIINIILKKSNIHGINGSINLSAGTRLENGSFNLNLRHNKFGMNAYFSGHGQFRSTTNNQSNRISTDTSLHTKTSFLQNGQSNFVRNGYQTGVGFDWSPTKKDNFSGSFGYHHYQNNDIGTTNQESLLSYFNGNSTSDTFTIRNAENHSINSSQDYSLNYKRTFKKENQELNISYNLSNDQNNSNYSQSQNYIQSSSIFSGSNSKNPGTEKGTELSIDYTQPFGEDVTVETGVKYEQNKLSNVPEVNTFNGNIGKFLPDPSQSYSLNYKSDVYAYYLSTTFAIGKILDVKAGGRYEYTVTNGRYSNAPNFNVPSYSILAPSFIISHSFSKSHILKISYSYRIERPEYRDLNPFVNLSDPHNMSMGNPSLKPEIGNNFELGYNLAFTKGSNINVALIYRRNTDDIQNFTTYYPTYKVGDSTYTDVSVSTRKNINSEERMGGNISGTLSLNDKFTLRSNVFLFDQRVTDNSNGSIQRSSFGYRMNLNETYLVAKDLSFEFFGNFRSKESNIQGTQTSFISYNMAIKKQFLNKKLSIGITANNPFSKYVDQTRVTFGTNFTQTTIRQIPYRSFGISLMYKFGKLEFKKSKEEDMNNPNAPF